VLVPGVPTYSPGRARTAITASWSPCPTTAIGTNAAVNGVGRS